MTFRISIDAGGTFTDYALMNEKGEAIIAKARAMPQDLSIGKVDCINKLAQKDFRYGS
jgi:N-methylhydantoinase A/oxoprolinase/acetone carboxylase beta subunit